MALPLKTIVSTANRFEFQGMDRIGMIKYLLYACK